MKTTQNIFQGPALVQTTIVISAGLNANRESFAANGVAFASFHYAGPEVSPHAWTVNGAVSSQPAALNAASGLMVSELEITAAMPGVVEVSVNGSPVLTVTAV